MCACRSVGRQAGARSSRRGGAFRGCAAQRTASGALRPRGTGRKRTTRWRRGRLRGASRRMRRTAASVPASGRARATRSAAQRLPRARRAQPQKRAARRSGCQARARTHRVLAWRRVDLGQPLAGVALRSATAAVSLEGRQRGRGRRNPAHLAALGARGAVAARRRARHLGARDCNALGSAAQWRTSPGFSFAAPPFCRRYSLTTAPPVPPPRRCQRPCTRAARRAQVVTRLR